MTPKTAQEYLSKTEHAVRHLYDGIAACWAVYESAMESWNISRLGVPFTEEERERVEKYLELAKKYFDLKFSEATFCGSILQIAAVAIRLFSENESIPSHCKGLFAKPPSKKVFPFLIGEEICGLPKGLIIYAGRNQYNHWDDDFDSIHMIQKIVFETLNKAHQTNNFLDLAFDLWNPSIPIRSNHILLSLLKWRTYETYLKEMRELLLN